MKTIIPTEPKASNVRSSTGLLRDLIHLIHWSFLFLDVLNSNSHAIEFISVESELVISIDGDLSE